MPVQQVLQQKLFATKKRLSEPLISEQTLWCLGFVAILSVMLIASHLITHGGNWGLISFDIPVASQPPADAMLNNFKESPTSTINKHTTVLAITSTRLVFGDVFAFSSPGHDVRNKFSVDHELGSPQVTKALEQMSTWRDDRKRRLGIRPDGILIIMPDPIVPIALVSVVADSIRKTGTFSHIVVGGGLL